LAHRHAGQDPVDQMRRARLHAPRAAEGQKPRHLRLKATTASWPQDAQRSRTADSTFKGPTAGDQPRSSTAQRLDGYRCPPPDAARSAHDPG
jgi:hypothetical protein